MTIGSDFHLPVFEALDGGGEGIVGLKLHHWPDDDPQRGDGLFGQGELSHEVRVNACACLVAGEEAVAKRLDDVIKGAGDVGDARCCQQRIQAAQQSEGRADFGGPSGALCGGAPK